MTEPVKEILPRGEVSGLEEVLDQFSTGIEELVNFGTHILKWELEDAKGSDENLPIAMMLRHLLEMLDSVSILVKHSSIDPNKLLLRGMVETFLSLEYILDSDTKQRALSFLVVHYHQQIKLGEKLNPGSATNKSLQKKYQADKLIGTKAKPPMIDGLSDFIDGFRKLLAMPLYAPAEAEYQQLIAKGINNPKWFQFYNGPKTIEQLATTLQRHTLYEVMYRGWSGSTHGTEIIQGKLSPGADGKGSIIQLRYAKEAQQTTMHAFNLAIMTYQIMITKRIPARKTAFANWYPTVQQFYLGLTGKSLINYQ